MTDDIDSILDAALGEYSNLEPRPGLEHRVLLNIRAVPPARHSSWWAGWVLTAAALALIVLRSDRTRVLHRISRAPASSAQLRQPIPSRGAVGVREKAVAGNRKMRSEPPKLETFPEPEPLTPEERELLRFVQSQPPQAREALGQSAQSEELTIEPLKIEELP